MKNSKKYLLGILSVFLLLVGWGVIFGKIGLSSDHVLIAKQNFLLPSLFLSIALLCPFFAFFIKNKRILLIISLVMLLASAFDMYRFASKWQSFSPQNLIFPDVGVTRFFQTIKNQRTFGNYQGQVSLYYELPSVEGYDALYPERFGEFVGYVDKRIARSESRSTVDFPRNGTYSKDALNLLGVKYIVQKVSDSNKPWTLPVWDYPNDFKVVYKDDAYIVFENQQALPRVFIAGDYIIAKEKTNILNALFESGIDKQKTLILEQDPRIVRNSITAQATIISYSFNNIRIAAQTNKKALLFLSDTYFPGWHAYVDGKETPIYRADYAFRSIVVPAGKHMVVFSYFPNSFIYGVMGTLAGVVLLGILYYFCQKRSV